MSLASTGRTKRLVVEGTRGKARGKSESSQLPLLQQELLSMHSTCQDRSGSVPRRYNNLVIQSAQAAEWLEMKELGDLL